MPPKRSFVLKAVKRQEPVSVYCEWEACDAVFEVVQMYLDHITDHLQQLFQFSQDDTFKKQVEQEDAGLYGCYWRDCSHDPFDEFPGLMRHVYFHAFHTKIKSIGRKLVMKNSLQDCLLDPSTHNLIPDIPERFTCSWQYCSQEFDIPELFYMHINNHCDVYPSGNNVEGGCKCHWEGCSTLVKSKHKLKDHIHSHTQEKVVACPSCGALFSNMTRFYDHLKRQLESDGHSYQCSHCNKKYATERLLKEHMRHHVNYYQCPLCDMTCPNPSNLRLHFRYRHTDSRPFICDLCSHTAKTQNDLRRHQETHKPWIYCEVEDCQYRCHTLPDLTRHCKLVHTMMEGIGRLLYLCHLCNICYTTGINLTTHLRKKHKFRWPPGHVRFRYKFHNDGYYRLQTVRYESIELTQQIMASDIAADTEDIRLPQPTPSEVATSGGEKETPEDVIHDIVVGADEVKDDDYSYNLSLLRDVALNDPAITQVETKGVKGQSKAKNSKGKSPAGKKGQGVDLSTTGKGQEKDANKPGKGQKKDASKMGEGQEKDTSSPGKGKKKDPSKSGKGKKKDTSKPGKIQEKDASEPGKDQEKDSSEPGKDQEQDSSKPAKDQKQDPGNSPSQVKYQGRKKSPLKARGKRKRKRRSQGGEKTESTEKVPKKKSRLVLRREVTCNDSNDTWSVAEQHKTSDTREGWDETGAHTQQTVILPSGQKILITSNIPVQFAEPIQVSDADNDTARQGVAIEQAQISQSSTEPPQEDKTRTPGRTAQAGTTTPQGITIEQTQAAFLGSTFEATSPRNRIVSPKGSLEQKIQELVALRTGSTHSARVNLFPGSKKSSHGESSLTSNICNTRNHIGHVIGIAPLDNNSPVPTPDVTMESESPNKSAPTYMESTPIGHGFSSRVYFRNQNDIEQELSDTELDPEINQYLEDAVNELNDESV